MKQAIRLFLFFYLNKNLIFVITNRQYHYPNRDIKTYFKYFFIETDYENNSSCGGNRIDIDVYLFYGIPGDRPLSGVKVYSYARTEGDFHAENIRIGNGEIFIDFIAPDTRINDIQLGVPVSINIENGVAAMALAHLNGVTDEEIKQGMASFRGVDRRFDFKVKNDKVVFLSDYAHHPAEIAQSVKSIRDLYQDKKITAIFQPHLYTRTRDFYKEFANSLSLLDEVILVDIYPAREQPIPGVTSQLIYDNLRPGIEKCMCKKEDILELLSQKQIEVLITLGAGDIDNYVPEITKQLTIDN